jgi:hypothetical protein
MKKLPLTIALCAAFVSAPALAQAAGGGATIERDQTRAEAQQRADGMFQMLDANKDGTLTKAEAQTGLAQFAAVRGDQGGRAAGRIQRMIDGAFGAAQSLTKAQFEALVLAKFDAMDLDHNGRVTAAERQQLRAQRQAQGQVTAAPATAAPQPVPAPAKPQ